MLLNLGNSPVMEVSWILLQHELDAEQSVVIPGSDTVGEIE